MGCTQEHGESAHGGLVAGDPVRYLGWRVVPEYGRSFGVGEVVKLCARSMVSVRWPGKKRLRVHHCSNLMRAETNGGN